VHRLTAEQDQRDEGAVLLLTLVLTVILGAVACAVAAYAAVGLRTSGVTDRRLERVAATDAGLRAAGEMLKTDPGNCALGGVSAITFSLDQERIQVRAWCEPAGAATSEWKPYRLRAEATRNGVLVRGSADVQGRTSSYRPCVAATRCIITINSWAVSQ
jgi:hypothetical protein